MTHIAGASLVTFQAAVVVIHLAKQGLITDVAEVELADQALADHQEDVVVPMAERFREDNELLCIMNPPTKGDVGVHFNDAQGWLIGILACTWLM